jgi:hypothetical protein
MFYVRKKLTAIRLKPEHVVKLGKIAAREDVPVSWLIRRAIDEFLKRHKWVGASRGCDRMTPLPQLKGDLSHGYRKPIT